MSIFRSFSNVPLVNQPEAPPTKDEMAADLALEMCERIKAWRVDALAREQAAEPPLMTTPQMQEAYDTLDALMKGQHRWVVVPVILEHFPELITPAKDAAPESLVVAP